MIIQQFGRESLKAVLYSHRKRMSKAQRKVKRKRVTNIYPWATERRYAATIKAWLKPMMDFVAEYLKNNQEAILRGDAAALTRNDAVPGGSFRRMVLSLNGWLATYIPNRNEAVDHRRGPPVVYLGLSNIAESLAEFTSKQWNKAAVENLGVEFAVYEGWWPDTKKAWADKNYDLIKSLSENYISQVNQKTELAVMNGWSPRQLVNEIMKVNDNMKKSKANLIARDQIGKLNGQTTQARMEAVGLDLYEWSTCGDERVRGDPSGKYPNGRPSHYELDGKICRWDDPTVYSEDGGKTWKDRPSSWCQLHPGYDIQCRCTALSYWAELIDEVDKQIWEEENPGEEYGESETVQNAKPMDWDDMEERFGSCFTEMLQVAESHWNGSNFDDFVDYEKVNDLCLKTTGKNIDELVKEVNDWVKNGTVVRHEKIDNLLEHIGDIEKNPRIKTVWETGTSQGSLNLTARDEWEANILGIENPKAEYKLSDSNRPVYAEVVKNFGNGVVANDDFARMVYGDFHIVMSEKNRIRTSFTISDSSCFNHSFQDDYRGVFTHDAYTGKNEIHEAIKTLGKNNYIEAQIWGGVDLSKGDVKEFVMSESLMLSKKDDPRFERLLKIAKEYNIKVTVDKDLKN